MQEGSIVECINIQGYPMFMLGFTPPILGTYYTIKTMERNRNFNGGYALEFHEILNALAPCGKQWGYESADFREVQPPIKISISDQLPEKVTNDITGHAK